MSHNPYKPPSTEEEKAAFIARKQKVRDDAKWRAIQDVDWDDLDHFISNCRRGQDKESFDTAIRILEALKKQVLER